MMNSFIKKSVRHELRIKQESSIKVLLLYGKVFNGFISKQNDSMDFHFSI